MRFEDELREEIRRSRAGDNEARERLLEATRGRVQIMIRARLGAEHRCWHLIEDLTQDVHISVIKSLPALDTNAPAAFRAFLSQLVQSKIVDHFRREGRQPQPATRPASTSHSPSSALELLQSLPASATSPSGLAVRTEQIDLVLAELAEVSERHRQVLTLAFFDELETTEIGEIMNITRPAAAMLLLRAVRALENRWQRQHKEDA